jgi:hypothetical protein
MGHADGVKICWEYSSGHDAPPPQNEKEWVNVIEPIMRPAGEVVLLFVSRPKSEWRVLVAEKQPEAQPLGPFRKVETKPIDKRAEVVAALKAKGLPVEDN